MLPLCGGIELCGSSSCLEGLRSLLSTEGILTLPTFLLSDGSLVWMWSASFAWQCRMLLSLCLLLWYLFKFCFLVFCVDVVVSDGTGGLISMIWNSFFQGPVGFTYVFSCAVVSWAFQWWIISVFCASRIASFGCMSKDLMVLVPLKKTLTLYFARVCLYCSLRPLMYGMTTLAPSIILLWMGLAFCWLSLGVWFVERTVFGSGCLVGLCEGDPFPLQGIQV